MHERVHPSSPEVLQCTQCQVHRALIEAGSVTSRRSILSSGCSLRRPCSPGAAGFLAVATTLLPLARNCRTNCARGGASEQSKQPMVAEGCSADLFT